MRAFRKKRRPGNRAATVSEAVHIALVKSHGCVCCYQLGFRAEEEGAWYVEGHHLLHAGLRIGHSDIVGLCCWHHRGQIYLPGLSIAEHRLQLGPALSESPDAFHARFGSDMDLMELQAELLGIAA